MKDALCPVVRGKRRGWTSLTADTAKIVVNRKETIFLRQRCKKLKGRAFPLRIYPRDPTRDRGNQRRAAPKRESLACHDPKGRPQRVGSFIRPVRATSLPTNPHAPPGHPHCRRRCAL